MCFQYSYNVMIRLASVRKSFRKRLNSVLYNKNNVNVQNGRESIAVSTWLPRTSKAHQSAPFI